MKVSLILRCLLVMAVVVVMGCSTGQSSKYVYKPSYQRTREQQKSYLLDSKKSDAVKKSEVAATEAPEDGAAKKEKKGWWIFGGEKKDKSAKVESAAQASGTMPSEDKGRAVYRLKSGDQIIISLRGIPREDQIEDIVDENGNIALAYINTIHASGLTSSELERVIRQSYLDAKIYKNISVNVVVPAQSYFVRGEVRQPGRYPLLSGVTLVQAVAAAGGYTEFANSKKVQLIRGSERMLKNVRDLERHPEKDVGVEAGDVIVVPRSVF